MTVSSSSNAGVEQTLDLANRLRSTVQEFAARETELNQEFRVKIARERQRQEEAGAAEMGRLEDQRVRLESDFEAAKAGAAARHERRKAQITRARTMSKEQTLERIEGKTGAQKYELQKKLMQAERDREAALAHAAATRDQFKNDLAIESENLAALEKSARAAFRGYGKFRRQLARAGIRSGADTMPDGTQLVEDVRELLKQGRAELERFRKLPLPLLFRFLPPWLLFTLCLLPLLPWLQEQLQLKLFQAPFSPVTGAVIAGTAAIVVLILHFLGKAGAGPGATRIAASLGGARRLLDTGLEMSDTWYQQEIERIGAEFKGGTAEIDQELKRALKENLRMKGNFRETIDDKTVRINQRNDEILRGDSEAG